MIHRSMAFAAAVSVLALSAACMTSPPSNEGESGMGKAVILGEVVTSADTAKRLSSLSGACPDLAVSVNGTPVTIEFDSDCGFAITDVLPSELVEIRVELVALGVAGTVEVIDVIDGELIEIIVHATDDSLVVSVERRTIPAPSDVLPEVIDGNNVSIELPAGVFEQNLTVRGNRFTLVGAAGESCDDQDGWTVIDGVVIVEGNKATFQNILFVGPVEIRGNKARFINCCFGDGLVVYGNNADIGDDDDDKHDDNDDDHDDDD